MLNPPEKYKITSKAFQNVDTTAIRKETSHSCQTIQRLMTLKLILKTIQQTIITHFTRFIPTRLNPVKKRSSHNPTKPTSVQKVRIEAENQLQISTSTIEDTNFPPTTYSSMVTRRENSDALKREFYNEKTVKRDGLKSKPSTSCRF